MIKLRATITDQRGSLRASSFHDLLGEAVHEANRVAHTGDECLIEETLESLTGVETLGTIQVWRKESDAIHRKDKARG